MIDKLNELNSASLKELAKSFAESIEKNQKELEKANNNFIKNKNKFKKFIETESFDCDYEKFSYFEWKSFLNKLTKWDFRNNLPFEFKDQLNHFVQELYFVEIDNEIYAIQLIWGQGETIIEVKHINSKLCNDNIKSNDFASI